LQIVAAAAVWVSQKKRREPRSRIVRTLRIIGEVVVERELAAGGGVGEWRSQFADVAESEFQLVRAAGPGNGVLELDVGLAWIGGQERLAALQTSKLVAA
jgi:hypothetical protein